MGLRSGIRAINPKTISTVLFVIISAGVSSLVLLPLDLDFPKSGLDPSWRFALDQLSSQSSRSWNEVLFTHGPFAFLTNGTYHPATYFFQLFFLCAITASFSYSMFLLLKSGAYSQALAIVTVQLILGPHVGEYLLASVLVTTSLLTVLNYYETGTRILAVWLPLSVLPLSKGTLLVLWTAVLLLTAVLLSLSRKPLTAFLLVISQLAGSVASWAAIGFSFQELIHHVSGVLTLFSGYSEAMSTTGPGVQVVGGAAIVVVSVVASWVVSRGKPVLWRIGFIALISIIIFLAFKSGFTRHDNHIFMFLFTGSVVLSLLSLRARFRQRLAVPGIVMVVVIGSFLAPYFVPQFSVINSFNEVSNRVNALIRQVSTPTAYKEELDNTFALAVENIAENYRVNDYCPRASDIYPSEQAALASNPSWDPRPTFQSYSAYNEATQSENLAHLRQLPIGSQLLVDVSSIDNRLPLSDEPAVWWEFKENFEEVGSGSLGLCLEKTSNTPVQTLSISTINAVMDNKTPVIDNQGHFFDGLQILVEKNFLGQLLSVVYKPNILMISMQLEDGEKVEYRLVPSTQNHPVPVLLRSSGELSAWLTTSEPQSRVKSITIREKGIPFSTWKNEYVVRAANGAQ